MAGCALVGALAATVACSDATGPGSGVYCDGRPAAAVVDVADEGLDLAIHAELGLEANEPLTCGALAEITELGASSRGIESIEGIENLTGLTVLNIRDNLITDIAPLASLTGLTWLNLAANQIGDIEPLRPLTALTFVALNDNGAIVDIGALSALTSLSGILWLSSNSIESLEPLRGLTGITHLRIFDNRITDLSPLADLPLLTQLNAHINLLTSADGLATPPSLDAVNLRDNPALVDIQALIDNPVLVGGTDVNLTGTAVSCTDVAALEAKGVAVISDCT